MEIEIKHSFVDVIKRSIDDVVLRLLLLTVRNLCFLSKKFYSTNYKLSDIISRFDALDYDDRGCYSYEQYREYIAKHGKLPFFAADFDDEIIED